MLVAYSRQISYNRFPKRDWSIPEAGFPLSQTFEYALLALPTIKHEKPGNAFTDKPH